MSRSWRYFGTRVLIMIPTFLGITLLSFLFIQLAPGGPVQRVLAKVQAGALGGADPEQLHDLSQALNARFGFDQSLGWRYVHWLQQIVHLDFGESYLYAQPVTHVIGERLPVTLAFGAAALIVTYVFSIGLGLSMARFPRLGAWLELGVLSLTTIPAFALGIGLLWILASGAVFDILPLGYLTSREFATLSWLERGVDLIRHALLPLFCYFAGGLAGLAYLARTSIQGELRSEYVRTARAKGVGEARVWFEHMLRNALIPMVAGLGGSLCMFFGGSILVETVFQIDGLGALSFKALAARDYNLIMGLLVIQSLLLLAGNLLGDLLYMSIDPRVHFNAEVQE